jgi:RNA polymerase sigma-32 factor
MATVAQNTAPEPSLSRYLHEAYKIPMLSAEEEVQLASRWRDFQDRDAADQLITSHLRLVARIAAYYRGYGLPYGELLSEGTIGMMQAVRRFNPDRGYRLSTYGTWWIRAAIQEYVLRSMSLVKMGTTAAQKRLFFNLRRLERELDAFDTDDLLPEHITSIAKALDVSERDVISMHHRMGAPDYSLNSPLNRESGDDWEDQLADERESPETAFAGREMTAVRRAQLAEAMGALDDRQRRILAERWLKEKPSTLEELAERYGVSRERIRQIEMLAINKLRKVMKTGKRSRSHFITHGPNETGCLVTA